MRKLGLALLFSVLFLFPLTAAVSVELTAGSLSTCAVVLGSAICWGNGATGVLGTGSTDSVGDQVGEMAAITPIKFLDIGSSLRVAQISTGMSSFPSGEHTCVLFTNKKVKNEN
jgi:hypothetical protein